MAITSEQGEGTQNNGQVETPASSGGGDRSFGASLSAESRADQLLDKFVSGDGEAKGGVGVDRPRDEKPEVSEPADSAEQPTKTTKAESPYGAEEIETARKALRGARAPKRVIEGLESDPDSIAWGLDLAKRDSESQRYTNQIDELRRRIDPPVQRQDDRPLDVTDQLEEDIKTFTASLLTPDPEVMGGFKVDEQGASKSIKAMLSKATAPLIAQIQSLTKTVGTLAKHTETREITRAVESMKPEYPQLARAGAMDELKAKAYDLAKTGSYSDTDALLADAALLLWGRDRMATQQTRIREDHSARVRGTGTPIEARGDSGAGENLTAEEIADRAFEGVQRGLKGDDVKRFAKGQYRIRA